MARRTKKVPKRIQLSRRKGWRIPPNTVKVDRTTKWGNPYRIGKPVDLKVVKKWGWKFGQPERVCANASEAVSRFRSVLSLDGAGIYCVQKELRGKDLACWCKPGAPCHADVLLEVANA